MNKCPKTTNAEYMIIEHQNKSCTLNFTETAQYLYVLVEGNDDCFELSAAYWRAIVERCHKFGYRKVLVEENVSDDLTVEEVYRFTLFLAEIGFKDITIAFVDRNDNHYSHNQLAQMSACKLGVQTQLFSSFYEAEAWLLSR